MNSCCTLQIQAESRLALFLDVELVELDEEDVERIVKTARVVINTVGPFHRYGTPVVRACVRNTVHYVDVTGETS